MPHQILSRIREVLNVSSPPNRSKVGEAQLLTRLHVKSKTPNKIDHDFGHTGKDFVASRDLAFTPTAHGADLGVAVTRGISKGLGQHELSLAH